MYVLDGTGPVVFHGLLSRPSGRPRLQQRAGIAIPAVRRLRVIATYTYLLYVSTVPPPPPGYAQYTQSPPPPQTARTRPRHGGRYITPPPPR